MKKLLPLLFICICTSQVDAQSLAPQKGTDGKFWIRCANLYLEVDSAKGARISSFKINENELMYVDFNTTDMAGSTFWPSPQTWAWPPAANLDSKPYSSKITGDTLFFKGATDPTMQLRFYKTMVASDKDTSITIEYVIKNEKLTAQSWAPWEITRVPATGLTVFAKESGSVTGDMAQRAREVNGYLWYNQTLTNSPGNKLFCDGKGWIAHVTGDNYLFVKIFENISAVKKAPNEAEVEIYTAGNDSYTELENQGAYNPIGPKDSVRWKVKWVARALPSKAEVSIGSKSLTDYIESILALNHSTSAVKASETFNFIKLYPNPAAGQLVIETGLDSYKNVSLTIFNLPGEVILSQDVTSRKTTVDIQKLTGGIYLYALLNEGKRIAQGKFSVVK